MNNYFILAILGGAALVVVLVIYFLLVKQSRKIDFDAAPPGEKPDWIATDIPEETIKAFIEDQEEISLYDLEPGEDLAAPFAEQTEDILRSQMEKDPELKGVDVDFGTGPDGGIEFHIGGETYRSLEEIPDEQVRKAIQLAIARYNQNQ